MKPESESHPLTHIHTTVPLPSKVKQIDVLQILRAAAVLLVCWGHVGLFPVPHAAVPALDIYGIDVFFVISGFIMSYIVLRTSGSPGPRAAWDFFLRRVIRIFPIYWVFALLGIIRYGHSHRLSLAYAPSLFLLPLPQYPRIFDLSWTMMFEMFFYTAMALTLLVTTRYAVPVLIAVFSAAVIVGQVVHTSTPFLYVGLSPMLLEFVFGAVIALGVRRFHHRRGLGAACVVAGCALAIWFRVFPTSGAGSMQMILAGQGVLLRVFTWGLSAALLVGGAVLWSPAIRSRTGVLFVIIGNASYSIYIASVLVGEFTYRLLLRFLPPKPPMSLGATLVYEITTVLSMTFAGWLSYQFIEWPMVRKLQRAVARSKERKKPSRIDAAVGRI